jgi:hypothetical protein
MEPDQIRLKGLLKQPAHLQTRQSEATCGGTHSFSAISETPPGLALLREGEIRGRPLALRTHLSSPGGIGI